MVIAFFFSFTGGNAVVLSDGEVLLLPICLTSSASAIKVKGTFLNWWEWLPTFTGTLWEKYIEKLELHLQPGKEIKPL